MAKQRQEIHFRGRVQGVGFRWTTQRVANRFAVEGYVRNLADGRVQLVVEGEEPEIAGFLQSLEGEMGRYIEDKSVITAPPNGEFRGFNIRY